MTTTTTTRTRADDGRALGHRGNRPPSPRRRKPRRQRSPRFSGIGGSGASAWSRDEPRSAGAGGCMHHRPLRSPRGHLSSPVPPGGAEPAPGPRSSSPAAIPRSSWSATSAPGRRRAVAIRSAQLGRGVVDRVRPRGGQIRDRWWSSASGVRTEIAASSSQRQRRSVAGSHPHRRSSRPHTRRAPAGTWWRAPGSVAEDDGEDHRRARQTAVPRRGGDQTARGIQHHGPAARTPGPRPLPELHHGSSACARHVCAGTG